MCVYVCVCVYGRFPADAHGENYVANLIYFIEFNKFSLCQNLFDFRLFCGGIQIGI